MKADENQPQLPHQPRHQIDFRQFFPPPEDISPATPDQVPIEPSARREKPSLSLLPRTGCGGSDWLNVLFVLVTIAGGFLFSIRYFGGPEPFRRTASWPREFLYPRPPISQADAKIDNNAPPQNPAPDSTSIFSQQRNSLGQDAKNPAKSPLGFGSNGRTSAGSPSTQLPTSNPTATGSQESARGESDSFSRTRAGGGSARPGAPGKPPPKTKHTPQSRNGANISEKKVAARSSENAHANANAQQVASAQKAQRGERLNQTSTATRIQKNAGGTGGSVRGFSPNRAGGSFGGSGNGFGGRN